MAMYLSCHVDKETQTWVIAQMCGMLARHGLKAGRAKHQVFSASEPMIATKLIVNRKPSLSAEKWGVAGSGLNYSFIDSAWARRYLFFGARMPQSYT